MSLLIAYATIEGHTGRIVRFLAERARAAGREFTLANTLARRAPIPMQDFDRVLLAAPVHERRHPEAFEVFLAAQKAALNERKTLFLSVSLSAAFEDRREEAQDYVTEMEMRTGFAADRTELVAGAVGAVSYDYFEREVLRHVVLKDSEIDPDGPQEFTDWEALGEVFDGFVAAPA